MAENESLDLDQPGGQRWKYVLDAVRKRKSPEEIAHQVKLKLPQALIRLHPMSICWVDIETSGWRLHAKQNPRAIHGRR